MGYFKYRAMSPNGERIDGEYESKTKEEVISMITSNGYYPLKIEESKSKKKIEFNSLTKVTLKDIAIFCRQFYTMLDAGVTINRALTILSEQTVNKKLRQSIKQVEEDVKKGDPLSNAMKKHDDTFPNLLVSMIEVGEVSGNLDRIMKRMSDQYEKDYKIQNKVKAAMIYPMVVGVVAILVVAILMTFVIPSFIEMFNDMNVELPLITKILISLSQFARDNIIPIWSTVLVFIIAMKAYLKTEHGYYTSSSFKLKFPVLDKLNQKIIVSRFTRTMSVLLSSGIPMVKALELVSGIVDNKIAENQLMNMKETVIRGDGLYKPMKESDIFPNMLATMVNIGEETGAIDEILYKTADFYDEELETQIQTTASLIEPILIVFMGGIVAFIVVSIMMPMVTMYDSI